MQKNREGSWVNVGISVWKLRGHWFEFAVASKVFSYVIVIEKRIYFYIYSAAYKLPIISFTYKSNSDYRRKYDKYQYYISVITGKWTNKKLY